MLRGGVRDAVGVSIFTVFAWPGGVSINGCSIAACIYGLLWFGIYECVIVKSCWIGLDITALCT